MAMRHVESREGLGQFVDDKDPEKALLASLTVDGAKLWTARYPDIPLPKATAVEMSQITEQDQELLKQAILEYSDGELTPELVTNYWRAKLKVDGKRARLNLEVPDCNWTEEEIKRPMVDIKGNPIPSMMVYKPEQIKGKEGLILLGKMYPKMASHSVRKDARTIDTYEASGWVKVEATIDAPNRHTRQKELEGFAKKQGYLGQRLSTYILASQASKDLSDTESYLDQGNTWSRLLGSRAAGRDAFARFGSDGDLCVRWGRLPQYHIPDLGARFEDVRRP